MFEEEQRNPRANAPRFGVNDVSNIRPKTAMPVDQGSRAGATQTNERTTVKQSGMFNKGSMNTDIITWDNPYQSRGGHSEGVVRDRKMIEDQLAELDLQVEKATAELSNIMNHQPKTGVTMKKRRELEDKLEVLEKQRSGLKSRLRIGFSK